MKFKFIVLTAGLFLATKVWAQDSRPKVAIKTFENPANFSRSTIGNGLTDILTTELQNAGKFNVMERSNVDELMREMDFANTEYAKSSSFAQKGHVLGAQYILMGKVTNFSYAEHAEGRRNINLFGPDTIETVFQQQADVRVDFRLVDVSTGETIISQAGEAHKTNTSQVSEMATWYRCISSGSITAELSSSLIGRATTEAVKDIVRKLNSLSETVREHGTVAALNTSLENLLNAKGQIVAEEGGGLWIVGGIGSSNGLTKGDRLKLIHENVVKDKAGKVVYRKAIEAGSMEVTDVSQSDHAEARFLPSPTGGTAVPQLNDLVSVDVEYARTIRGGAKAATPATAVTSASSFVGTPAGGTNAQLQRVLKRADGYINDKFWSQALDEYKQAAAINPNEPRVLQGEAISHYMMGDFIEGDEGAEKLLQGGGALTVPVAHYHSMGVCTGELTIQRGHLAFKSGKSDGFDVAPTGLGRVDVHRISKPMVVNEEAPDWPVIEIRWRDSGGHEKKYQLIPYMFSKQQNLGGKNFASAFPMDDSDVREMQKLEQSLLALIQKYVK